MFKIMRQRTWEAQLKSKENEGFNEAVKFIRDIMKEKDKVYLEPVTLGGDETIVRDCCFLGSSLLTIDGQLTISAPREIKEDL